VALLAVCLLCCAAAGTLSTGEWRPTIPPFDFLAYVDADEARRQADGTPDRLSYLNEHGIGM